MSTSPARPVRELLIAIISLVVLSGQLSAQEQTVGLFVHDSASFEGYTLFSGLRLQGTYLIDHYGRLVHSWESDYVAYASVYLLEDGNLLRGGQMIGTDSSERVQEFTWDGTLIWDFVYSDESVRRHHDIEPMPGGTVLILAWEFKTKAEAIAAGRDSTTLGQNALWPEHVVEVHPVGMNGGTIVWEWHLWDHLIQDHDSTKANYGVVEEHPELIDINYLGLGFADWQHANSVDYNPQLDQIVISCRSFNEIWVIDHSTTAAEAAGHTGGNSGMGGDILYRWGNPVVYRAADSSENQLDRQHDARWIEAGLPGAGNILVFNNGSGRGYSSVDEIVTPVDENGHYPLLAPGTPHGPAAPVWTYTADPPDDWLAFFISGATRMPNGNTLICSGPQGDFFEVSPSGQVVWRYVNPVGLNGAVAQGETPTGNAVFRCTRIAKAYPALQGRDLTPGGPLEIYPVSISGTDHYPTIPAVLDSTAITAAIGMPGQPVMARLFYDAGSGTLSADLFDDGLHWDGDAGDGLYGAVLPPSPESTYVSYYIEVADDTGAVTTDPPNPPATAYHYRVITACGNIDGLTGPGGQSTNIADLAYLVSYLFLNGPPPPVLSAANVDGIGGVDVADLSFMVNYLFFIGQRPIC